MSNTVRFKRIGTSQNLGLVGHSTEGYYAEWSQSSKGGRGALVQEFVNDGHVQRREKTSIINNDFSMVKYALTAFTGLSLTLDHFIESYYISARDCPNDRDFIKEHDITDMTTREVITETGIVLTEYFAGWNKGRRTALVVEVLRTPPVSVLNMRFDTLHDLIHRNNHKPDYTQLFFAGIEYVG